MRQNIKPNPKLKNLAEKIGVELDMKHRDPNVIDGIRFSFPPETWADLGNKEGKLLPYCCANVSTMRGMFMSAMREDGLMSADDMGQLVANMAGHDYDSEHPATKVKQAFDAFSGSMRFIFGAHDGGGDVEAACSRVMFGKVFRWCADYATNSGFCNWGKTASEVAEHNLCLFEIIPTIKLLNEHVASVGLPPVEGWALVRKATGRIYEQRRGLAIRPTKEAAEALLEDWVKFGDFKKKDAEIKACRVSWENGLEIVEGPIDPFKFEPGELSKEAYNEIHGFVNKARELAKCDRAEAVLLDALHKLEKIRGPIE